MPQDPNISQELNELGASALLGINPYPFVVPADYFDQLPDLILRRAKAENLVSVDDELSELSPLLASIPKINPYKVPDAFFKKIEIPDMELSAKEEIAGLSPLLNSISREMPYTLPANYFSQLDPLIEQNVKVPARVVKMGSGNWRRLAVAAAITAIVTLGALFFINRKDTIDPNKASFAWVEKNLNKVSSDDIEHFVDITDSSSVVAVQTPSKEVEDLMKNISDNDIQQFLKDTDSNDMNGDNDLFN